MPILALLPMLCICENLDWMQNFSWDMAEKHEHLTLLHVMVISSIVRLIFPKWNGNSVNSWNLINHWSMNWSQFKNPVYHLCLAGSVVASRSLTLKATGLNPFNDKYFLEKFNWSQLDTGREIPYLPCMNISKIWCKSMGISVVLECSLC